MPHAFNAKPDHPAVLTLLRLHADIGGQILDNQKQAAKLRQDMKHVEAVIRMFDPAFNVRPIAVRRRKPNPWFKRGTVFRHALDVLRAAEGPLTAREITVRMLAAQGVTDATKGHLRDLIGSVQSTLANRDGRAVVRTGEGMPARWAVA